MCANLAPYLSDGPEQRQVILLKLSHELESCPSFPDSKVYDSTSPQRQWLARVGALMGRIGVHEGVVFRSLRDQIARYGRASVEQIKEHAVDAVEKLRLELHLEGRDDIGVVYESGELLKFYSDLSNLCSRATHSLYIVDPYLNGEAYTDLIGPTAGSVSVRVLCNKHAAEVSVHSRKFNAQYGETSEVRNSKEMHDRLIIIDGNECWLIGSSIKDGGKKPTYLLPLSPILCPRKIEIYEEVWGRAETFNVST